MSSTTVYLVRHATAPWVPNREASRPLSATGRREARRVAATLSGEPIDVVVSSPYARARETVEPLAAERGLDIAVEPGVRERALADGPVESVGETFGSAVERVWDDWSAALPGGESNDEAQARGVAALDALLERHAGETVAVGTHGQLLTLVLNHYDDRFDVAFWRDELTTPDVYEARFSGDRLTGVERRYSPA